MHLYPHLFLLLSAVLALELGASTAYHASYRALVDIKFISPRGGDNPDAPKKHAVEIPCSGRASRWGDAFDRYDVKTIEGDATRTIPSNRWAVEQPAPQIIPAVGLSKTIAVR